MKLGVFLILLFCPLLILGQSETDNWFFGENSGLAFIPNRVTPNYNGNIKAPAGCAVISDYNRELLFYTNGATVWNKNHEVMENGEGLAGEIENAQSSIIIPKPGSSTNYYIFNTRKTNDGFIAGVRYSEIELSDSFPLGKVISKNNGSSNFSTQKIAAAYSSDGNRVYVIAFGTLLNEANALEDTFSIYEVSSVGVSDRITIEIPEMAATSSEGVLKISPDGKLLAVSVYDFNEQEAIHLLNFDRNTGAISYDKKLSMNVGPGAWTVPYGLEFSKDSKYIYHSGNYNYGPSYVRQLELESSSAIGPQSTVLSESNAVDYKSLQLASDGKIYISKVNSNESPGRSLSVIHNPTLSGLDSNFQDELFRGFRTTKGLPNFIANVFEAKILADNQCYVDPFIFSAESYTDVVDIVWDFGDGTSGVGINASHIYNAPGNYTVEALLTLSNNIKTKIYGTVTAFELPTLIAGQELEECDDDTDGLTTFNLYSIHEKITDISLNEELYFYLSQDDLINDNQIINPDNFQNTEQNQLIHVKVVNENGCWEKTTFKLNAKFVPLGNISSFYTCENSDGIAGNGEGVFNATELEKLIRNELNIETSTSLTLYRTKTDAQTNTNPLIDEFLSPSATIFIKGQQADLSCAGIQEFDVVVNPIIDIDLQETYEICFDPSIKPPVILNADSTNERFEWRDASGEIISENEFLQLDAIGEYSLTVYRTQNGITCSNSKNFKVINPEKPIFVSTSVNTEDETNNIVEVSVNGNSNYAFSIDNIHFFGSGLSHTFTQVPSGLQTVFVKDINDCEEPIQTTVAVIGFAKYFTPNDDGKNDFYNIKGLDPKSFQSISLYIFNRFGKIIYHVSDFDDEGWDGRINGNLMDSGSYWFKAKIVDKEDRIIERSGNFSLLRE